MREAPSGSCVWRLANNDASSAPAKAPTTYSTMSATAICRTWRRNLHRAAKTIANTVASGAAGAGRTRGRRVQTMRKPTATFREAPQKRPMLGAKWLANHRSPVAKVTRICISTGRSLILYGRDGVHPAPGFLQAFREGGLTRSDLVSPHFVRLGRNDPLSAGLVERMLQGLPAGHSSAC